jgi:hypothetical protein
MRSVSLTAAIFAIVLAFPATAMAQGKVKSEPVAPGTAPAEAARNGDRAPAEPISDLSRLTEKARKTRERILEAAKTGDIGKVATVMQSNEMMPVFSFGGERNPVEFWKSSYPDSEGIEVLAILIEILEMPFVHADKGTPQEMFVWPYFYAMPLAKLTPEQKVELFRLVTGTDWREMSDFGAYIFFRVGISPDGVWHFFVAGD